MINFYYEEIKKERVEDFLEGSVDNFWNNCLPMYFTQKKMYGIEQQSRALKDEKRRPDFTIRCVRCGSSKNVFMFEDKRKKFESQSAQWAAAIEQLTEYLVLVRNQQPPTGTLYGSITVGTYARFYSLKDGSTTLQDFVKQDQPLELKDDEEQIHQILTQWVELTKH